MKDMQAGHRRAMTRRGALQVSVAAAVAAGVGRWQAAPAGAQSAFPTRVRVFHGAPDLGKVEVRFNGQKTLDEFTYGSTSDWIDLQPGVVRVSVNQDRAGLNWLVFDTIYPVAVDNDYTLVLSSPLVIPAVVDTDPLPANTSRVRFIHASVDTPAVDVAVAGKAAAVANVSYGQLSAPLEVPAGTVDMEVRRHGTNEVLLPLPGGVFKPGMTYEAILYGKPGSTDTPLTVTWLTDDVRPGAPMATPMATPTT
jgi:hypothetical protein